MRSHSLLFKKIKRFKPETSFFLKDERLPEQKSIVSMPERVMAAFGLRLTNLRFLSKYQLMKGKRLLWRVEKLGMISRDLKPFSTCSSRLSDKSESDTDENLAYPGHIATNFAQKIALSIGSGLMAISDPSRADMVATFGETTGHFALKTMRSKMEADPVGRLILEEKPRIRTSSVDPEYLSSLPNNTFGKAYSDFLVKRGFSPDERPDVHYIDDPELAYVMLRYRECHDLFHVILDAHTNMLGEIAVKWVEGIQLGLPMCVLGAIAGPARLGPVHRQRYFSVFLPWSIEQGFKAKFLMNIYYEKHWEDDIDELRKEMNIEPAPKFKSTYKPHASNLL